MVVVSHPPPTHLASVLETLFCSQRCWCCRGSARAAGGPWQLDNVSSSWSGTGIAASSRWGGTLRGTKFSNLYEYRKQVFFNNSRNFWVPPHTFIHTYICIYVHTYIRTYVCTYIHTYIHAYIHIYVCTYIHVYIHMYVRTYILNYLKELTVKIITRM